MSHKIYPNLAHLDDIGTDLNYTGFILDGWNHPVNLVPVVMFVLLLFQGLPRSFTALWVMLNCCVIHPWMDGIIGMYGIGPKYLVDEYAILDSRYWVTQSPDVMAICVMEFYIMTPLCYMWYKGVVQKKWYRHYYAILASVFQLCGTIVYVFDEGWSGLTHLPATDSFTSPKFDSYEKIKYFWIVFVCLNNVWIILPSYICYKAYTELKAVCEKGEAVMDDKKKE